MPVQVAPGPTGLKLILSLIGFYRDPLTMFTDLVGGYGDVARLALGPYRLYVVVQPAHVKQVLQDNNANYRIAGIFDETRPVVGQGLTTNNGDSWRRQRRLVQPGLHRQHIAAFADLITTATATLIERWRTPARSGVTFDIWPDLLQLNHRILGQVLFGIDLSAAVHAPTLAALETVRSVSVKRATALLKIPNSLPTPENLRFQRAVKLLDEFAYTLIRQHRQAPPNNAVLSMLIVARDPVARDPETDLAMSDRQLHDEIMTLFFAAYEDPANALAWAWYLLAGNPRVEQRLRTELAEVLQGRPPALSDLARLPYTTMVIDETLRLYPPTWGILRDVVADDEIGGYVIPAGSTVFIDSYLTHRLPTQWPNPEQFDPFRFAPEATANRPRYAYLPFGGGPRQCIGNALAMMEMQLVLTMLTQAYHFQLAPGFTVKQDARNSLRPHPGLWLRLQTYNTFSQT